MARESQYARQVQTIKERGASAYVAGVPITACPYVAPSKQGRKFARIWRAGWVDARDQLMAHNVVLENS